MGDEDRNDLEQFGRMFHWRHALIPVVIDKHWRRTGPHFKDWEMNVLYIFGIRVAVWRVE